MTRVGADEVRRVAALARLAVREERLDALAAELDGILAHMDTLRSVDLSAVEASTEVAGGALREDVVDPIPLARRTDEFAPLARDGFFLVPRVASHEPGEARGG